jgi:hypothetical protein
MNSDFKDLLRFLNEYRVRYLVIGGHAVSYYTEPRYTKDIGIWIEASSVNARKIMKALSKFGAPVDNISTDDFAKPGTLFVFGVAPNRVDILNRVKGASFASAWKDRVSVQFEDIRICFISRKHLLAQKKAANRPRDKLDVKALLA